MGSRWRKTRVSSMFAVIVLFQASVSKQNFFDSPLPAAKNHEAYLSRPEHPLFMYCRHCCGYSRQRGRKECLQPAVTGRSLPRGSAAVLPMARLGRVSMLINVPSTAII